MDIMLDAQFKSLSLPDSVDERLMKRLVLAGISLREGHLLLLGSTLSNLPIICYWICDV